MKMNIRYKLNPDQKQYIKDIFNSHIGLPTKKHEHPDYWYKIEHDFDYLTKVKKPREKQLSIYY